MHHSNQRKLPGIFLIWIGLLEVWNSQKCLELFFSWSSFGKNCGFFLRMEILRIRTRARSFFFHPHCWKGWRNEKMAKVHLGPPSIYPSWQHLSCFDDVRSKAELLLRRSLLHWYHEKIVKERLAFYAPCTELHAAHEILLKCVKISSSFLRFWLSFAYGSTTETASMHNMG